MVPPFEAPEPWWSYVEPVTAHLDELLGTRTAVLRLVDVSDPVTGRGGRVTYHVEASEEPRNLDRSQRPDWDRITQPHPFRTAWAYPGGPRRLLDWAAQHVELTGPPVQLKTWNLSCVYRLPTATGPVWMKATSPFMRNDADIIQHVSRYDASLVPAVLASDTERQWSLLAHAPGEDCYQTDEDTIRAVVRRWVAVQASAATEPLPSGVPELPSSALPAELAKLLDGEAGAKLGEQDRCEGQRLLERMPELVAELESAGLPHTLVHGDFHSGNWRSDGSTLTIVDWADAFLGDPAYDAFRLSNWLPDHQVADARRTWADAWRTLLPGCEPERATRPMTVLAHVISALVYQRFLDNIETDERVYHEDDPVTELQAAFRAL